jgi:CHAP domain protein
LSKIDEVLSHAAYRIGYYAPDDPEPGSEAGRWLAKKMGQPWLAGPSEDIWWCMAFVSMCFDMAGEIAAIGGFSYNTDVTKNRMEKVSIEDAQRGDVVLFDWDQDGLTDHVGIVEANLGDGWLQTIEGNTSPSNAGSQSAGNGVYRRQRSYGIDCVLRPKWSDADAEESSEGTNAMNDAWWGRATTYALQASLNTPADGIISDQDIYFTDDITRAGTGWEFVDDPDYGSEVISALQQKLGVEVDGIIGPDTISALQQHLKNRGHDLEVDGVAGYRTVECLQYELSNGTLWS